MHYVTDELTPISGQIATPDRVPIQTWPDNQGQTVFHEYGSEKIN